MQTLSEFEISVLENLALILPLPKKWTMTRFFLTRQENTLPKSLPPSFIFTANIAT